MNDIVLNVLPADSQDSRIVVALEQQDSGDRQMVLRQESFSSDVGWFVQSRVMLCPDQVNALKATMTSRHSATAKKAPRSTSPPTLKLVNPLAAS